MRYAAIFRMTRFAYSGAIRVYDDGQASVHRYAASPDKPVLIEIEGEAPTEAQIITLANIWRTLSGSFEFSLASFSDELMPHVQTIMGVLELPPAA